MKRLTVAFPVVASLVFALTATPQAAESPYLISIINQSAWVDSAMVEPTMTVSSGRIATACIWVDPASGRAGFDGGFDFLVCYDADAMSLFSVEPGPDLHAEWEYFNWSHVTLPDSCAPCPGGFVRIVGLTDMLNDTTPDDAAFDLSGCIASLTFTASTDASYANDCYPIGFCALDCGDNTITNRLGDSLFIPTSGVTHGPNYDPFACMAADSAGRTIQYAEFSAGTLCIEPAPPDLYEIAIIDQSQWINEAVADPFFYAFGSENVTACLWVDPASGRDGFDGGFDFLVCYDPYAMTPMLINPGPDLHPDWEYFTYRLGSLQDSCGACPDAFIRVVGIADMLNGVTPPDEAFNLQGCIAELTFIATADRAYEDTCYPVGFCALDCGDNTITNRLGDSLFIPFTGVTQGPNYNPATCMAAGSLTRATPYTEFKQGFLCIMPAPPNGGDVNLNGISNEIGDALLFGDFFLWGVDVFFEEFVATQIAETEVSCDGIPATTVDLMYMINVVTGGLAPCYAAGSVSAPAVIGPTPSVLDSMVLSSAVVTPGELFPVELYLRNVDSLGIFNFRLRYDPSAIAPVADTTIIGPDTTLVFYVEFPGGTTFELRSMGQPSPGVLTGLAVDFDVNSGSLLLPTGGVAVEMQWLALPSATSQISTIAFENDPDFPHSFNTLADYRASIWKRPTLINGTVTITGAVCDCPNQADLDDDGVVTSIDLGWYIDIIFFGAPDVGDPNCPTSRTDFDGNGVPNSLDLAAIIDHVFFGGVPPADPCAP